MASEIFLHFETNCNFIKIQCQYKGCGQWFLRSELQQHQKICEHRTIKCDLCKEEFKYCYYQQHFENCPCRNIECGYCNKIMKFCENEKHCEVCEEMIIFCEKCNQQVKRKNYSKHLVKDCLALQIDCQICDKKLKIDEIKDHETKNVLMHQKQLLQKYTSLSSQQEFQQQQVAALTERVSLLEQENQKLQSVVSRIASENLQFKTLHSKLTDKLLLQEVAFQGVNAQHLDQIKQHISTFKLFQGKLLIFDLIYQSSLHGLNYQSYLEKITKQSPVLVLVINQFSDIFGGFTCKPLDTFAENTCDQNSFIFSLTQNLFFNNCMPNLPAIKTDSKREGIVFGQGGEQAPFGVVFSDPKDRNCFAGKKIESFGYDNYMLFNLQRLRTHANWSKNKQTVYFGINEIFIFKLYYF